MEFKRMIGMLVVFFIIGVAGLTVIDNNIETGNIEDTSDLQNKSSVLRTIDEKMDETYAVTNKTYRDITADQDPSILDIIGTLIQGGYNALIQFVSIFGVLGNIVQEIAFTLGVPQFVVAAVSILILGSIAFTIIYMLFRFEPRSR